MQRSVPSSTARLWWGEPPRAWAVLGVGVLAVSAHSALSLAFSVLMKPITASLEIERAVFASAMTLRMILMVVSLSWAGLCTDRWGARSVLTCGAALVGSATAALATTSSFPSFLLAMALIGPGQAAIGSVAASALVLRRFRRRRGLAIGLLNGGDNFLNAGVPLLTAWLLEWANWRVTLAAWAGIYLALAALICLVLRPDDGRALSANQDGTNGTAWRACLRHSGLWLLITTYVLTYAFITSVQLHLHAFQTDLGRSNVEAANILSTQILVGAVGSPLFGWLAERMGPRRTLLVVLLGLTIGSLALWNLHSYPAFLGWAVLYGLINSGVVAVLALVLAELFGAQFIGRLMGVAMTFCMASTMLANLYSASLFDAFGTYRPVWQTYSVSMLLALVPASWLLRAKPQR